MEGLFEKRGVSLVLPAAALTNLARTERARSTLKNSAAAKVKPNFSPSAVRDHFLFSTFPADQWRFRGIVRGGFEVVGEDIGTGEIVRCFETSVFEPEDIQPRFRTYKQVQQLDLSPSLPQPSFFGRSGAKMRGVKLTTRLPLAPNPKLITHRRVSNGSVSYCVPVGVKICKR
jgi:hypothetical protein